MLVKISFLQWNHLTIWVDCLSLPRDSTVLYILHLPVTYNISKFFEYVTLLPKLLCHEN